MNEQYFGDHFQPSEKIEATDPETSAPAVIPEPFADKNPVDAALIHETPMGGTLAAVGPMNGPLADEIPLFETPNQEIPMGGTVAAVRPMDEPFATEIPLYETPARVIPVGEAVPAVSLMNEPIVREEPISSIPYTAPVVEPIKADYLVNEPVVYKTPIVEPIVHEVPVAVAAALSVPLLNHDESEHFRTHWNEIQGKFVDDPRIAVQQADALVAEVVTHLTQMFATEHSSLESQWNKGNDVSTEDLRKALQHYRSFFNRLVV